VLRIRITLMRSLIRILLGHSDADPDPTFHFDADLDPKMAQNLEEVLK
jgi:hypothetical protein